MGWLINLILSYPTKYQHFWSNLFKSDHFQSYNSVQNSVLKISILYFNPFSPKIAISTEPIHYWTSDQSVNSSLSVLVQWKKARSLHLSQFNRGGPTKFKNTFLQIGKLRFLTIFNDFRQNSEFSKNSQGTSLKARGLIFWILAIYIHIL